MNTERVSLEIGGIDVEVVRKEIKNLHVGVYPPSGRVRVAAPLHLDEDAVRLAVVSRLGWIRNKQKAFSGQDRQSVREMTSGESHYFQGRRYLLDVVETAGAPTVRLRSKKTIELRVPSESSRTARVAALNRWYRQELRALIAPLLAKWEPKVGRAAAEVRIRRMRTRWGSCNPDAGRIWLNLELIKKPVVCVEYVLVHELVHLHERHHTEKFRERMEALMPGWRLYRDELNRAPLAHEDWKY